MRAGTSDSTGACTGVTRSAPSVAEVRHRGSRVGARPLLARQRGSVQIPRGVEHRPVARDEVELMLIEPKAIRHTGNVESEMTVHELARI